MDRMDRISGGEADAGCWMLDDEGELIVLSFYTMKCQREDRRRLAAAVVLVVIGLLVLGG